MHVWTKKQIAIGAAVAGLALAASTGPAYAATAVVTVNGNDNPYLAGQAAGVSFNANDSAPNQSPALALTGFDTTQALTFTAVGGFGIVAGQTPTGPDGFGAGISMLESALGIAGSAIVRPAALVGVFMGDTVNSGPAPEMNNTSTDSPTFSPLLHQIFFIGDGRTGGVGSPVQQFFAPEGATRLFLGSADVASGSWFDNPGSMVVTIDYAPADVSAVPEASTWAMMIVGFGMLGAASRRRHKRALYPANAGA